MLNWWLGRPAGDAPRGENDPEPPETPARIFAARAFKSALFGTPGFSDEEDFEEPQEAADVNAENTQEVPRLGEMSPTKPQGILLTPGTATTRRKTVSFGASVVDNEGKNAIGKSGVPNNLPGKFPSPWTSKVNDNVTGTRLTALTRTLEAARDDKTKKPRSTNTMGAPTTQSRSNLDSLGDFVPKATIEARKVEDVSSGAVGWKGADKTLAIALDDFDGDMTLDLNEPHSQSGQYWKSEYEKYHEEAKAEMRKLVKYKQLAKSYAKKKDSEAIDLAEKLKEEQQKVVTMEAKVSELVSQIAERRLKDTNDESPELMKDLARQTTLVMEYRHQVDQFQAALQERDAQLDQQNQEHPHSHTSRGALGTLSEVGQQLKRARKQLAHMGSLREEMHNLQLRLSVAEKKVTKLQDENIKLSKDLANVGEQLNRSEKRRHFIEAEAQKKNESFQSLERDFDTLKELAKSQRREAEHLLRKRHDQIVSLKKEVASLKDKAEVPVSADIKQVASRNSGRSDQELGKFKREIAEQKAGTSHAEDLMSFESPPSQGSHNTGSCGGSRGGFESVRIGKEDRDARSSHATQQSFGIRQNRQENVGSTRAEGAHLLDSKIPVLEGSTWKSKRVHTADNAKSSNASKNGIPRSAHIPLVEIINGANTDESPPAAKGSQLTPSFQERFSNLSLESPKPELPSLEPSLEYGPTRVLQTKQFAASPRPSMFHIALSPTRQTFGRPRSSGRDAESQRTTNTLLSTASSMMSSRARTALPPDRAAAAKARLEQKQAEKRRTQELGDDQKENVR